MKIKSLFATQICLGKVQKASKLNKVLLKTMWDFQEQDKMGQKWSETNYRGGYTSYASLTDLHHRAPVFSELQEHIESAARTFAKSQEWDLRALRLEMTAMWMNVMPKGTYHTLHFHPNSVISGAYFVETPKGSVSLKLEDPRMGFYMNAPIKKKPNLYHSIVPEAGCYVLFDSWLRHEVPPNESNRPRVSISFNFSLVERDN